jgi:hypothetical protein
VTSTSPGARGRSSSAYEPDRHDQVEEVVALPVQEPRSQGADQLEADRLVRDRLEPVAEELGVEADLQRLARVGDGKRLPRLPDVLRLGGDRQLAVLEAESQRRLPLRE